MVGFADGGPERGGNQTYRGGLYAIYLLEEYQRKGIGHRLVSAVAQRLWVDWIQLDADMGAEGQPSRPSILRVSGRPSRVGCQTITIGGLDVVEVSYGWKDVAGLVIERAA